MQLVFDISVTPLCVISDTPTSLAVQVQNCSLPRTYNGQLIYGCTKTVIDSCSTCSRSACPISPNVWATCIPPGRNVAHFRFLRLVRKANIAFLIVENMSKQFTNLSRNLFCYRADGTVMKKDF